MFLFSIETPANRKNNTFALIKSRGNGVYKVERRYLRALKVMQSQFFDDLTRDR